VFVGEGRKDSEDQARRAARPAVAEHCLEQLRVELALAPRAQVRKPQRQRARPPPTGRHLLHDHQAAANQPIARFEEPAAR
jgi:hypothetical protein